MALTLLSLVEGPENVPKKYQDSFNIMLL